MSDPTEWGEDGYSCYCGEVSTEEECDAIDHNGYSFIWHINTCSERMREWAYDDAATQCSDDPWDLIEYAASCCSDGLSVCESLNRNGSNCFSDCAGELCAGDGTVASCMADCGGKLLLYIDCSNTQIIGEPGADQ